jgi:hypothetical protein
MKFMLISYATKEWEAGLPPDPRLVAAIPRLSEMKPKADALVGTGGLAPSSMGAKVRVSGGKVLVTDGPFTETKEIVGGYAIVDVRAKEEAVAIAKAFWQLHVDVLGPTFEGGGEIRQMFHQEECGPQHQQVGAEDQFASGPEHRRLGSFVGRWNTEGTIRVNPGGPPATFHAVDTYEWVPGGFFVLHRWDAHMPDGRTQGVEILGYDAARRKYTLQSFDSAGNIEQMTATVAGDTWTFEGKSLRFRGSFRDGGNTLVGEWDRRTDDGAGWEHSMDVKLSKVRK